MYNIQTMSSQILNISINENIAEYTTNHILKISKNNIDFSEIAIIMSSKRPSLFIKKELSRQIKKSFIAPKFFTFDELVNEIDKKYGNKKVVSNIDSAYMIYEIVRNNIENNDFSNTTFSDFFEWSFEILNFINSLDVEKIDNSKLLNLKLNADIGYDLPQNINDLLKHLYRIRIEFHNKLDTLNKTTSGYSYYNAGKNVSRYLKDYKKVILFNPYYLNKAQVDLIKEIYNEQKLDIILRGDNKDWIALQKIYKDLNVINETKVKDSINDNVDIYSVNDNHSQACLVRELISKIPQQEREKTVVVIADNSILQPVMSQLYCIDKNINIAVGYPAKNTTIFSLMNSIIQIQKNKSSSDKYYVKDIVSVISNPLVKNMRFIGKPEVTRIIVHEIVKNFDRFNKKALFKGYKFISLEEIINNEQLCNDISQKISDYWQVVSPAKVKDLIYTIFELFIINFNKSKNIKEFGKYIKDIADNIVDKSLIYTYSFNIGAVNILYDISGQFINSICSNENFNTREILKILEKLLINGNISLVGTPLKGLQVLGLMETRGLNFDNVFVLSMIDSVVPNILEVSPLIPKDISILLGVGYTGRDIDIQKYHFMSLICGAKKVSLIYPKNNNVSKSRFIEELVWKKQLKEKKLDVANITEVVMLNSNLEQNKYEYKKTDKIKEYLSEFNYSATSIDTYMQCKLKFYYKYVLRLSEQVDYDNDYENIDVGNCIHEFLMNVFCKGLKKEELKNSAFKKSFSKKLDEHLNYYFSNNQTGNNFLLKKLIKNKLNLFYDNETGRDFKEILDVECNIASAINIVGKDYRLNAKLDRIDMKDDGTINIIDYKTGKVTKPLPKKIISDCNFNREIIKNNIKSFQLIIYKYLYEKKYEQKIDNCALYSIKNCDLCYLLNEKQDRENIYNSTIEQLKYIISEINSDEPFKSEIYDYTNCEDCPYFYLCR